MKISSYVSSKFKIFSFFCIVLVLYIHSPFQEANKYAGVALMQQIISGLIGMLAVPIFYIISGYLFYKGLENGDINLLISKIVKRFYSLLIPYLIGCLFFFLVIYFLSLTTLSTYVNGNASFENKGFGEILSIIFIKPMAFHLWFVRNLVVVVLFSPLLYRIPKYFEYFVVVVFFILSVIPNFNVFRIFESFLWFYFGWILSSKHANLEHKNSRLLAISMGIYIAGCIILLLRYDHRLPTERVSQLFGIYALWFSADFVFAYLKTKPIFTPLIIKVLVASNFTLFIYLFHEPTINIVRKIIVMTFGKSSLGFSLAYLASAPIFMLFACLIAKFLNTNFPKFYNILVGGRK